ncbi:GNAT family N-acetyltransferase [Streptomyces sp. GC420]|uniref:GNAT family N-acetyltransferase n=1 Tax=Streptomyces sp. GC420 TaxID=2697568 RepID=UPI001415207B|nr:GNAT family N-acetyltransferase [Streptomyces sp. GC420]NBM15741.1 GNAT family N-acetyltransferase [Streptomyces sp. GC420]
MDHDAVLALFDDRMRRGARSGGTHARVELVGDVVREVGEGWAAVIWSGLDETTADAAIAEQVRHFEGLGQEFEWKLYAHDRPGDLAVRLLAAGFEPEPQETLMVAEIADLPTDVELPEGIALVPVTDPAGVDLMTRVHDGAFGTDGSALRTQLLARLAADPESFTAFVAMAGDRPVCASRMEFHEGTGFASLWGGGTVPEWRGRGIYRALVAVRTRLAAERGYRYLQVDASDQSSPILRRLGFVPLTTTTPYLLRP